ncbi:MAG: DUF222 domain-containing protein [Actinobacteria bacterium]|nr:DUF222 domain-containing protein [Actinomycetota bacterium]
METEASRLAAAEVGCALRIAPITARLRTEAAVTMVDQLPATLAAQQAGDLDGYRALIIAEGTATLSAAQRRTVEERVLRYADGASPSVLRDLVKRESIAIDPESAARRVIRAKAGRGVGVTKSDDDMAVFTALLGAPEAELGFALLDGVAVALTSAGLADGRTLPQLRADVLVDIFDSLATTGSACLDVAGAGEGEAAGAGADATSGAGTGADPEQGAESAVGAGAGEAAGSDADVDKGADATPGVGAGMGARAGSGIGAREGTDTASGAARVHTRTTAHRRTGAIVDLHAARAARAGRTGAAGAGMRRPVCLNVYVHASTLAGIDDVPGDLAGYGLITADTARALAASADTVRALVLNDRTVARAGSPPVTGTGSRSIRPARLHPPGGTERIDPIGLADVTEPAHTDKRGDSTELAGGKERSGTPDLVGVHSQDPARARACGTPLDAGRAVYRPPAAVSDYITARDRTCQFPGCRMAARRCDIDHRVPYDDPDYGATCPCNLDTLCRFHHRTKTFTAWRADPGPDGLLVWTSPVGRRYPTASPHVLTLPAGADPAGTDSASAPVAADRRAADRRSTDLRATDRRTTQASPPGNRPGRCLGSSLGSAPDGAVGRIVTDARTDARTDALGPGGDDEPPF